MRRVFRNYICLLIGFFVVLSGTLIGGRDIQNIEEPNISKDGDTSKLQLTLKTDLRVDAIHSAHCLSCDLPGIDAFYMSNIMVDVSNYKVSGVGVITESVLTVTYFDVMQTKIVTITKNLPAMNPYPTNPWGLQRFVVSNLPVLVKKSSGIKAEIHPEKSTVVDAIPSNNMKVVNKCIVMVY